MDAPAETCDSASIGMGKDSGSTAWVNQQTSIIGKEQVDISVKNGDTIPILSSFFRVSLVANRHRGHYLS
ncbi:hypothetical protein [Pseudodesulfovibrio aespoeensis]|uniref:hypothetical protein n=1 Tax=Pseudodesulfovibrio aespoeensis TaxID=182210 RepID=UPI0001BF9E11|nr:hypothetical protein [Pseudodesulfovibrio aespoeensis]